MWITRRSALGGICNLLQPDQMAIFESRTHKLGGVEETLNIVDTTSSWFVNNRTCVCR